MSMITILGRDNQYLTVRGEEFDEWAVHPMIVYDQGQFTVLLDALAITHLPTGTTAGWCKNLEGAKRIAKAMNTTDNPERLFARLGGVFSLRNIPSDFQMPLNEWNDERTSIEELLHFFCTPQAVLQ